MLRKLGVIGLGVPLIAIASALIVLLLFGTSEPTFDAATRELAREHTVVRIRDEPPAALIAPTEPPASVVLVVVLPDDERHVWSATRDLGLLDYVEGEELALIPATGSVSTFDADDLWQTVQLVHAYVRVDAVYIAAYAGEPLAAVCAGAGPTGEWSGVVAVQSDAGERPARLDACGDLPVLLLDPASEAADSAASMVQWMLDRR